MKRILILMLVIGAALPEVAPYLSAQPVRLTVWTTNTSPSTALAGLGGIGSNATNDLATGLKAYTDNATNDLNTAQNTKRTSATNDLNSALVTKQTSGTNDLNTALVTKQTNGTNDLNTGLVTKINNATNTLDATRLTGIIPQAPMGSFTNRNDVVLPAPPASGDVMAYNASTGKWTNGPPTASGGSQTPLTANVNAAGNIISNLNQVVATNAVIQSNTVGNASIRDGTITNTGNISTAGIISGNGAGVTNIYQTNVVGMGTSISTVTIFNTTTTTSLYSNTIPAGMLGTNKDVWVRISGYVTNNSGSSITIGFIVTYGASILYSGSTTTIATGSVGRAFIEEIHLSNIAGNTSSQWMNGMLNISASSAPPGGAVGLGPFNAAVAANHPFAGSSSVDSTTAQILNLQATLSAASAGTGIYVASGFIRVQ